MKKQQKEKTINFNGLMLPAKEIYRLIAIGILSCNGIKNGLLRATLRVLAKNQYNKGKMKIKAINNNPSEGAML